eukprot:m.61105 g.61105  ORF g.61105 m.61105 type:complete len:429 (-) comp8002_c0_seq1:257-1543(-)
MLPGPVSDSPPSGTQSPARESTNVTPRRRKQLGSQSSFVFPTLTIEVLDDDTRLSPERASPRTGAWTMSPHPRNKNDPTPTPSKQFNSSPAASSTGSDVRKNLARDFKSAPLSSPFRPPSEDDLSVTDLGSPRRWSGSKDQIGTRECPLHSIANQLRSDFDTTVEEAAEAIQILAIQANGESARDIVTAGIIEPLVERVHRRVNPEEELAALQNLGATHDDDDTVKRHMADVGVIPAALKHVKPRNSNSSRLAVAVLLNLAIESEERKRMLYDLGACETLAKCLSVNDNELRCTVLNALTSLSIGSEQRKARIEATNIMHLLLEMIHNPRTAAESLSLIQSLVYCNDDRKRRILDAGLVKELTMVLVDPGASERVLDVGSKLLKGIAGFAEHEATKKSSRAADEDMGSLLGGFYSWAADYVAPPATAQ